MIRLRAPAGTRLHLDDRVWPEGDGLEETVELSVRVQPGALRIVA